MALPGTYGDRSCDVLRAMLYRLQVRDDVEVWLVEAALWAIVAPLGRLAVMVTTDLPVMRAAVMKVNAVYAVCKVADDALRAVAIAKSPPRTSEGAWP